MNDEIQTLSVTCEIPASPERVFAAWLTPELARKFWFATPQGEIVRAEIDGRIGGRFAITDRRAGTDVEHLGEFLDVAPPSRLEFSFVVPAASEQASRVTVDIIPSDGGSSVRLCHYGLPTEVFDQAREGWTMILENLRVAVREG